MFDMFKKFTISDWILFCVIIAGIILQIVAANGWAIFWSVMTLGWYTMAVYNGNMWEETIDILERLTQQRVKDFDDAD